MPYYLYLATLFDRKEFSYWAGVWSVLTEKPLPVLDLKLD